MHAKPAAGGGQVVVITGAGAGVGRATARAYAARGASVALLARGREGLEQAAREVRAAGGQPLPLLVDVADPEAVEAAAATVERAWGPVDVWINNACATVFAPVLQVHASEFRRSTDVTCLGYVHGTQAALRRMVPRDAGTVVQVGSGLALRGVPLMAPYCAAKHAVRGFHQAVRGELLHAGSRVRVTMVQLPAIDTPLYSWMLRRATAVPRPIPPVYRPEVAARSILHAADHPRRREYWVGCSTVAAVLGGRLLPGPVDRFLATAGYGLQQTRRPHSRLPANLWCPADDTAGSDQAAHGDYGRHARRTSATACASRHRVPVVLVALGAALAAGALERRARPAPGPRGARAPRGRPSRTTHRR